jgi:hypothetical protein
MAKRKAKAAAVPAAGPMVYTVPLELGGKNLTLEFNYRAYMAMHEYTGIDVLGKWFPSQMGRREEVCFLLAGAVTHHPDLEFEWVINQMHGRETERVLEALFDAYKRSMPEPDPEEAENPPKPVN